MKTWTMTISAVALAFSLSGCSSNHVIATKDGRMILTEGKPEMDDASGLVRYRDSQGHDMQINCNDISQIITR